VQSTERRDRSVTGSLTYKLCNDAQYWSEVADAFKSPAGFAWAGTVHATVMQLYEKSVRDLSCKPAERSLLSVLRLLPSGQAVLLGAVVAVWQAVEGSEDVATSKGQQLVMNLELAGVVSLSSCSEFLPGAIGQL
jgi:hypothetical protein